MSGGLDRESITEKFFISIALVAGVGIGIAIGLFDGGATAVRFLKPSLGVGALIILTIVALHQDELAVTLVLLVNLYFEWYLAYEGTTLILVVFLLGAFFFNRSLQRPWTRPRALRIWALFLTLTIFPAIRGAPPVNHYPDAYFDPLSGMATTTSCWASEFNHYPDVVFGAFIVFWLGTTIARGSISIRRFFNMLAVFGVLIAVHMIIQVTTGITLLGSSDAATYLASKGNFQLGVSGSAGIGRMGSFLIQPDLTGTFFAMMIFVPLGLFVESTSFWAKVLYMAEILIMIPALLFTYTTSAWLAGFVGLIAYMLLVGDARYRFQIILFVTIAAAILLFGFPKQVNLLIQHSTDPTELSLRQGVWQTGLRVIQAFPLTGVGLNNCAYFQASERYSVLVQTSTPDHPHNSYLEWAAMAGIPALLVFLILLAFIFWQALYNWIRANSKARSLIGVGIATAIVLSFNSWSNQGWTSPPLATLGWLLLGTSSSPLLLAQNDPDTKKCIL